MKIVPFFHRYIGVDYSGGGMPDSARSGIRVFLAEAGRPAPVLRPDKQVNWSRKALADWLITQLQLQVPTIVGIDHGFSFPQTYLEENRWKD